MAEEKREERFQVSQCGGELAWALMFIIEKGLAEEYMKWQKKKSK